MLEVGLFGLLAAATLETLRHYWQQQQHLVRLERASGQPTSKLPVYHIASDGMFQFGTPTQPGEAAAFRQLRALDSGIAFVNEQTKREYVLTFADIQWFGDIQASTAQTYALRLHLEVDGHWQILTLYLNQPAALTLKTILRQALPPERVRVDYHPVGPIQARIAGQNLQGDTYLEDAVMIYVLPHLLIVLRGDVVLAKLSTRSIQRVLAVEHVNKGLNHLLTKSAAGIVRLHSMYDTVAFALSQYRELADEIAYLARCPIEHIYRDDKRNKL
jgi:hypothetical protein